MRALLAPLGPSLIAFVSNMAIMVLELVAGRLAARNVGSSNYTWISIICVILAGMSVGNWYGGRLADRHPPRRILWLLFLLAAVAVLLTYPLNAAVGGLKSTLVTFVVEHPSGSAHLWGLSVLAMMALVFFLPAMMLGILSPVVTQLAILRHAHTARAIGTVNAAGAIGAVAGTFLTGFLLVPSLDVTTIIFAVAAVLAAIGVFLGLPVWVARLGGSRPIPASAPNPTELPASVLEASAAVTPGSLGRMRAAFSTYVPHAAVFLVSLCLMAIEMVASRFVARHVGSSIYTWTLVIGVIFVGMCLGNYGGGRLAARYRPRHLLGPLFLFASMLCASLLWSNQLLAHVDEAESWPQSRHRVLATLSYDDEALAKLNAAGLPAETVAALRPLTSEHHLSQTALVGRVSTLLPAAAPEVLARVIATAPLQGVTPRILREAGADEGLIGALRPLLGDRPRALEHFKSQLAHRLDETNIQNYTNTLVASTRVEEAVPFAWRLSFGVFFVFLLPAIALGLLSPVLAQLALERGRSTGRTVGNVYAFGAWGSIVGTFLAGFFLVAALGSYGLVAATSGLLALLAVLLGRPRLVPTLWLVVVAVLCGAVFHQRTEPDGFDANPDALRAARAATNRWEELWDKLPETIGKALHIRDDGLGDDAAESDYQFLSVASHTRTGLESDPNAAEDVLVMQLDNLVHGYLGFVMPKLDQEDFDQDRAVHDPATFEYDYICIKAVLTARAHRARMQFAPDAQGNAELRPPLLRSLTIGGGAYTYPRYFLARYPGEHHIVREGDTLRSLARAKYGAGAPSAELDVLSRVRPFNTAILPDSLTADAPLPAGARLFLPSLADVAELDPAVTELNHTRFKLPRPHEEPRIRTWSYDARNFVESAVASGWAGRYDVVYGDAVNHYSVPFHITTREFNDALKSLLAPGGLYLMNVIDSYESLRFVSALATTLRRSFAHVYVLVQRDVTARAGRATFVLAASDRPLPVERLGGVAGGALAAVAKGDAPALNEALADDPTLAGALSTRLRSEGPTALHAALLAEKRLDLSAVLLPEAEWAEAEETDDSRLQLRNYEALSGAALDQRIIFPGRARQAPPLASGLASERPPQRYAFTPEVYARLIEDGVPPNIHDKVRALEGRRFERVEPLRARLRELLPTEDEDWYSAIVLHAARVPSESGTPITLTDDFAPVENLLKPLLDD